MASRLERKLLNLVGRASQQFRLIEPGDRIMVAISGGKDSWAMLQLLRLIARRVPFDVSLVAVNLDQGHPGFPASLLVDYLEEHGWDYKMLHQDTYSVVLDKVPQGKTYCSLCSRLRRGVLYSAALDLGCNKIALGHHRDDFIETLLLNLFYSGQIKSMAPRLTSDDGRNVVIRPLVLCTEDDVAAYAAAEGFPIVPCDLCGTQENLQRQRVKHLLTRLNAENPKVKSNIFASLGNVRTTHLLDEALGSWGDHPVSSHSEAIASDAVSTP